MALTTSGRTVWSPRRRRLTIGLLLTVGAGAFEALAVGTVLPAANAELQDLRRYGLVFSAFLLTNIVGVVVGGRMADTGPPERPFVAGTLIFSAGLLVTGTASSMLMVAMGRALQGLGAGAVGGLAYYAVRRCYEESARPRMLALLSTAWVVPGLLGPALAAAINAQIGWRWVFLGLVPVMPVAALLAIPILRITSVEQDESVERGTAPVLGLIVAALLALLALTFTAQRPLAITAAVAAAAVGLPALTKVLPRGTVRLRKGQPAAVAFIVLAAVSFFGVEAFVPLALTSVHGVSIGQAGLVLTAASVTWAGGVWLQERLVLTTSRRALLVCGAAAVTIGVGLTGVVITTPSIPFWITAISWAVAGLGMGLCSSTAALVVLEWAKPGSEGHASSAAQLANLLGAAAGTAVAGLVVASVEGDSRTLAGAVRIVAVVGIGSALLSVLAAVRTRSVKNMPQ